MMMVLPAGIVFQAVLALHNAPGARIGLELKPLQPQSGKIKPRFSTVRVNEFWRTAVDPIPAGL
jgi:hypothetical protein